MRELTGINSAKRKIITKATDTEYKKTRLWKRKNNRQTPDLYLMLSPGFDTLHLKRGAEWIEAFPPLPKTMPEKRWKVLLFPTIGYSTIISQTSNCNYFPALAAPRNREYFREMLPALQQNQIHPLQILTLRDACQAIQAGVRVDMPKTEKAHRPVYFESGRGRTQPRFTSLPMLESRQHLPRHTAILQ